MSLQEQSGVENGRFKEEVGRWQGPSQWRQQGCVLT
jgi:hypothetical protein